jgi:hypothetical protein
MIYALIIRILVHGNPLQCGRMHVHHRLLDRGFSVMEILPVIAAGHALLLLIAFGLVTEPWASMSAFAARPMALTALALAAIASVLIVRRRALLLAPEPATAENESRPGG